MNKYFKLENTTARILACKECGYSCPYEREREKVICPVCRIVYGLVTEMDIKPTGIHVTQGT